MIDLTKETPISFRTAATLVPTENGGGVSHVTVWRWSQPSFRGVALESINLGGRKLTSREALHRFFAANSRPAEPPPKARRPRRTSRTKRKVPAHA